MKIFQYFFGHFENCPINVQNYPINVKCLRTPPVQAFHIDWVVFKFLAIFWHFLKNYPINVKCLHRGCVQAFHIDWVKLDLLGITHWLGRISKLPNQCEKFQKYLRNFKTAQSMYGNYPINVKCLQQAFHIDWDIFTKIQKYLRNFKTAQSMYGNYPINVKCLQQAFHIDWVVYLKNFLPISKLPNQCMKTSQSMWNACSKHFTLIGLYISKISLQFQNCLINVWKLPNQCEMLAASISHWLGCIFQKSMEDLGWRFKTA